MHLRRLLTTIVLSAAVAGTLEAQSTFTETFAYSNGALAGQGGWSRIGSTVTNPLTVTSGSVSFATTGEDVGSALGFSASSGSLYAGFDLALTGAQATGDYFLAFNTAATATNYTGRFFAKSSGSGYVLGYQLGVTGATPSYSSTVLDFSTTYRIVMRYDFVSGTLNDQGTFYVNPSSVTELSNTAAVSTITWAGTTSENASLAAIALRQGTASSAATISSFDNLIVSTSFSTAANISAVPEPSTYAALLGAAGLLGVFVQRRRRRISTQA
ncbi:MAG: PEP-CTERM sorting domain-containing protein [Opitutae bacterium]|nr:PEP-CTERM sorting domain-containing protein [Opitutae bacterium]